MIRLGIVVEGETEEEFVKRVVAVHLIERSIQATPILLGLKRARYGRGGNVTIDRVASHMSLLSHNFEAVTSLVDFYGFVDKGQSSCRELEQRITNAARSGISRHLDERRVFAYVQQHEFEALLFSDVAAFDRCLVKAPPSLSAKLGAIRAEFDSPEDINDSSQTAPSKRIQSAMSRYRKRVDGPLVAEEIGLERIRGECPRFNHWMGQLESLIETRE